LRDGELVLYNPWNTPEAVRDILLNHPDRLVSMARQHDHWFRQEQLFGSPWRLAFPYSVQLAGRVPFALGRVKTGITDISSHVYLYEPGTEPFMIMQGIIRRFLAFAEAQGFRGLIAILPMPRDVYRLEATGELTYQALHDFLNDEGIPFVDVIERLAGERDTARSFLNGKAHFSALGSEIVASEVDRFLREQDAIPRGGFVRPAHEHSGN
jgi:hypothetical protein